MPRVMPRVLLFDDLIGSDRPGAPRRRLYCECLGLLDEADIDVATADAVASASIHSGQHQSNGRWLNDLDSVVEGFREGWPNGQGIYWSLVLVDMKFVDDDRDDEKFGLRIIHELKALAPEISIVVVSSLDQFSSRGGESLRRVAERLGAEDFLAAPGCSAPVDYRPSPEALRTRLFEFGLIPDLDQHAVGFSLPVCLMLRKMRQLIPPDFVGEMLLLGEAGSGKTDLCEYVRREIARLRHVDPAVVRRETISLGTTSADMQKVTLFGTWGATGVPPAPGMFEANDRGVIFLDEIGELNPDAQSDLLPVLQPQRNAAGERYRPIRRIGATKKPKELASHAFIIAATMRDLPKMVRGGRFNEALLSRFSSKSVDVPPLRDRLTDLPYLIRRFVGRPCSVLQRAEPELSVSMNVWESYAKEHSTRDLENLIAAAVSKHRRKTILTEKDVFSHEQTRARPVPIRAGFEVGTNHTPTEQEGASQPFGSGRSVEYLLATIGEWKPSLTGTDPVGAFIKVDVTIASAKLRLLEALLTAQQKAGAGFNLKGAVAQLLGDESIPNTRPGDEVFQLFRAAGVRERPPSDALAYAWEKRRISATNPKRLKDEAK